MKKSTVMIAAMLAAGVAFAADEAKKEHAKGGGQHARMSFDKIDANSDGKVTLDEMKASYKGAPAPERIEARFKKMDANSDGAVTKEEWDAAMAKAKEHADKAAGDKPADAPK